MAAHLGTQRAPALLLLFAGAVTAVVAVVVGLPALRVRGPLPGREHPGLRLWFMQASVLATPCWTLPVLGKTLCTGPAQPAVAR